MKRLQNLSNYLFAILFAFLISGCSDYFYCYVNSLGTTPDKRTYYVTTEDSVLDARLDYKEYFQHLKARLNEVGYLADNNHASLKIIFELKIGEAYSQTTSHQVNQFVTTTIPATSSTSITPSGLVITSNYGGEQTTVIPKTLINKVQKIPIIVRITAVNNSNNEPVWEVDIWDTVDRETQIPAIMPWLLACAKDYFGRNSTGEKQVLLNAKKVQRAYGLYWPY